MLSKQSRTKSAERGICMNFMSLFYVNPSRLGDVPLGLEIFAYVILAAAVVLLIYSVLRKRKTNTNTIRGKVISKEESEDLNGKLSYEIFLGLENGETEKYLISGQLYREVKKGDQIQVRVRNGWVIRLELRP